MENPCRVLLLTFCIRKASNVLQPTPVLARSVQKWTHAARTLAAKHSRRSLPNHHRSLDQVSAGIGVFLITQTRPVWDCRADQLALGVNGAAYMAYMSVWVMMLTYIRFGSVLVFGLTQRNKKRTKTTGQII